MTKNRRRRIKTTSSDVLEKVHLATDITLGINFTKKIIQIESENWTVIAKRNDLASLSIQAQQKEREIANSITQKTRLIVEKAKEFKKQEGYTTVGKKVLTKDENILNRFMRILDTLLQLEPLEQVEYKKLKSEIMKQMIIPSSEFNNILNLAISRDLIEESDKDAGYYRLKNKKN